MKYQVIIIGGGPAGYTAAEAAAKGGAAPIGAHIHRSTLHTRWVKRT